MPLRRSVLSRSIAIAVSIASAATPKRDAGHLAQQRVGSRPERPRTPWCAEQAEAALREQTDPARGESLLPVPRSPVVYQVSRISYSSRFASRIFQLDAPSIVNHSCAVLHLDHAGGEPVAVVRAAAEHPLAADARQPPGTRSAAAAG